MDLPHVAVTLDADANCAQTSNTANKMAVNRFTNLFFISRADFLDVFGRVFIELRLAIRAAQLDFLALINENVRLAHVAAQLFAGDRAGLQQIGFGWRNDGIGAIGVAGRCQGCENRCQNHSRNQL